MSTPHFCFQTEIAKRLNAIIVQIMPFLSQEHQQQVATALERAKQVTMTELNAIIGQQRPDLPRLLQQMHAQQLPHAGHAPPLPMMPHPAMPGPASSSAASLLGLSGALGGPGGPHPLSILSSKPPELQHRDEKPNSGLNSVEERHVSQNFALKSIKIFPTYPVFLQSVSLQFFFLGHQYWS
ncbi:transducin-like enhancer protein 3-B isoform X2 [Diaphorina citri]|uniref:Transducin-like enhancer protein 3-B isoform X1 n=1 Tax=Diaphorina citri TaxID=121845 RepID=A0A3Q0JFU1_DIACI|nr:transducin-like enhancer protein 3-B isoform X1 [Diaphorina citri]XP_026685921.1 transducin-like enhancer protein 3-B isoform X2 [Diaphorina citri]